MATGFKNNKSTTKGIRFPHELIDDINASVEQDKSEGDNLANFSSWVIDACKIKLKSKSNPKG